MNILHITTYDSGGAGLAVLRLHRALLARGCQSRVLVLNKNSEEPEVYPWMSPPRPFPLSFLWPYLETTAGKFGIPLSRAERYRKRIRNLKKEERSPLFTLPFSDLDVLAHPLAEWADGIHLHWVADFVDYPSFFKRIKKPVIWTVRDENLYCGGYHYLRDKGHSSSWDKLDEELAEIKRKSIACCEDLTVVFLSRAQIGKFLSHPITAGRRHLLIPNGIDGQVFRSVSRSCAREVLGLPADRSVLCFVAQEVNDPRKGLRELLAAVSFLKHRNLLVCVVGKGVVPSSGGEHEIFQVGFVAEERLLTVVYSAADIVVMPSSQEAFSKVPLEALACGVPVVSFPCEGTEEVITPQNGVRVADFTVESLATGIEKALATSYDRDQVRRDIIERFGMEKVVAQYINLYREILGEKKKT